MARRKEPYKYNDTIWRAKRGFSAQMREFTKMFEDNTGFVITGAMFLMGNAIIESTPYKTGRAQHHWALGLNERSSFPYDSSLNGSRNPDIDDGPILGWKPGDTIFLYNNAPYIGLLEDGMSTQAGPGIMVAANIARWPDFIAQSARDLQL